MKSARRTYRGYGKRRSDDDSLARAAAAATAWETSFSISHSHICQDSRGRNISSSVVRAPTITQQVNFFSWSSCPQRKTRGFSSQLCVCARVCVPDRRLDWILSVGRYFVRRILSLNGLKDQEIRKQLWKVNLCGKYSENCANSSAKTCREKSKKPCRSATQLKQSDEANQFEVSCFEKQSLEWWNDLTDNVIKKPIGWWKKKIVHLGSSNPSTQIKCNWKFINEGVKKLKNWITSLKVLL